MPSKKITDRQKSFVILETTFNLAWNEVQTGLIDFLADDAGDDDERLDAMPKALLRRLKSLLEWLLDTDRDVDQTRGVERSRRGVMKRAGDEVRQFLLNIRIPLRVAYGHRFPEMFPDLSSHLLRNDPRRLLLIAEFALEMLTHPKPDVPVNELIRIATDGTLTPQAFAGQLRDKVERLKKAYKAHQKVASERDAALAAKDEAMKAYNAAFSEIAKIFECLFRLSNNAHWTKRLQPARQEPGLLLNEVKKRRAIRAGRKAARDKTSSKAPEAEPDSS